MNNTERINLPKTLDQLIFSKCSQNQLNISKFLPPKKRKTLRSYYSSNYLTKKEPKSKAS